MMLRAEVDDQHGTVAHILDTAALKQDLTKHQRDQLATLARELVTAVANATGTGENHARHIVVADLIRLVADDEAYERVAGRHGLLPL
jgi:hypothetical protein